MRLISFASPMWQIGITVDLSEGWHKLKLLYLSWEEATSAIAGFHAGPVSFWNWNLKILVSVEGEKLVGEPGGKPSEQGQEPTTNSTHLGHQVESNLDVEGECHSHSPWIFIQSNTPYSFCQSRTGTSLQERLMQGNLFKCKWHSSLFYDLLPHEPPLQACFSPIPILRI